MVVRCSEIVLGHAPVRVCGGCNRVGLQVRLSSVVPASARGAVASVLCALRIPSWLGVRVWVRVMVRVPWPPHLAPCVALTLRSQPYLCGEEGELLLSLAPLRAPGESGKWVGK